MLASSDTYILVQITGLKAKQKEISIVLITWQVDLEIIQLWWECGRAACYYCIYIACRYMYIVVYILLELHDKSTI